MIPKLSAIILTTLSVVQGRKPYGVPLPLAHSLIAQFPKPSWIENIAVRPNGDLILTQLTVTPEISNVTLYTIPRPFSPSPSPVPVHTFDGITNLFGIAESATTPDLFVLVGGNIPNSSSAGLYLVWTIDFGSRHNRPPKITQVTHLNASLPNGLTAIPHRNAVLIADSFAGLTWHVNLATGVTSIAAQAPEMSPPLGSAPGTVGINGIKIFKGYLYWTHSALAIIYRVRLDADGRRVQDAKVETVAKLNATFLDDFAIRDDGIIWATTNSDNTLVAVQHETGQSVVVDGAAGELTVLGDTAAAFGRERDDGCVLYVVTCGGLRSKGEAAGKEGAKVVAVDTRGFEMPKQPEPPK
jgi:hypothetical protein